MIKRRQEERKTIASTLKKRSRRKARKHLKSDRIIISLTPAMHQRLRDHCEENCMNMSEFIRQLISKNI